MSKPEYSEEPNVIKSELESFEIPKITLSEYLSGKLSEQDPDKLALISPHDEIEMTFGELHTTAQEFAFGLSQSNVNKTDLVLFFGDNSIEYVIAMLAITYMGVTFTPLSPANGPFELNQQLKDCQASVIIIDQQKLTILIKAMNKPDFETISKKIKLLVVMNVNDNFDRKSIETHINAPPLILTYNQVHEKGVGHRLDTIPLYKTSTDDYYVILYTSGTTGLPKGAIHTHYSWLAGMIVEEQGGNVDGGRELLVLPMGHVGGTLFLLKILLSGVTCIICADRSLENSFRMIEKYQINYLLFTPEQAIMIANGNYHERFNVSSLKMMQYGGSKTPVKVIEAIQKKFPNMTLMEIYGATEFFGAFQIRNFGESECLPGNVGTLVANYEMKIVDIETGQNLPALQHGEICVRGPMCFVGYLNNESATKQTIDSNGWYHSGDIGFYDQYGALHIVDRIKEMIKYKGWSVIPAEIEDFLHQHPNVKSVCVVGVKHITDCELLRAYVQLKTPGTLEENKIIEQQLHEMIKENLGYQKRLRGGICFVKDMPRTLIGKVDRNHFKKLVEHELIKEKILE